MAMVDYLDPIGTNKKKKEKKILSIRTARILDEIQEAFGEKLNRKTGWGKNEIFAEYKEAQLEVLKKYIDK